MTVHNDVITRTLTKKIQQLEREVTTLKIELSEAKKENLMDMLGALRLRGPHLVYTGQKPIEEFIDELQKTFGNDITRSATRHLF